MSSSWLARGGGIWVVLGAAACGSSGGTPVVDARPGSSDAATDAPIIQVSDAMVDAMPGPDAKPSTVQVVACAGAAPVTTVTVTTTGTLAYVFSSGSTIQKNDAVDFRLTNLHNAISGTPGAPDGAFEVGAATANSGTDVCLKFTAPGSFPFFCGFHLFTATLTVQ